MSSVAEMSQHTRTHTHTQSHWNTHISACQWRTRSSFCCIRRPRSTQFSGTTSDRICSFFSRAVWQAAFTAATTASAGYVDILIRGSHALLAPVRLPWADVGLPSVSRRQTAWFSSSSLPCRQCRMRKTSVAWVPFTLHLEENTMTAGRRTTRRY